MQVQTAAVVALFVAGNIFGAQRAWAVDEEIEATSGEADADREEETPAAATEATGPKGGQRLQAVVRGFYIEAQVGAGYMILNANVPYPPPEGTVWVEGSESLGVGGMVGLAIGYDITEMIAIQVLAGTLMVDSTRTDRVRDMGMIYGLAGARLAIDITDRLDYVVALGVGVATADNLVEEAGVGLGLMVNTGLEYFVHIRHFSVGFELSFFMPIVSDPRAFLALSPTLKYTF